MSEEITLEQIDEQRIMLRKRVQDVRSELDQMKRSIEIDRQQVEQMELKVAYGDATEKDLANTQKKLDGAYREMSMLERREGIITSELHRLDKEFNARTQESRMIVARQVRQAATAAIPDLELKAVRALGELAMAISSANEVGFGTVDVGIQAKKLALGDHNDLFMKSANKMLDRFTEGESA